MTTVTADEQLRLFIERIERMEEERKAIAADITDTFNEAKAQGYDTKVMRHVIKLRAMEPHDRQEMDAIIDVYRSALGIN